MTPGREALLPCPFCGAAATWREDDPARPYEPFGLIVDHSGDCFLRGVVNFDRESITSTWNTRPARENADDRAPALVEAAVAEMRESDGSVTSIPDGELIRRAILGVRQVPRSKRASTVPLRKKVSDLFCLGSTYSAQLCRIYGFDPNLGVRR